MGKDGAGPVFPHPLISNGCMCIHDRVRLMIHLSGWENNGPAKFFSTQITICTRLMLYLVGVGKESAGPVFPHPLKSKDCLHIHDRVWLMFPLVGVGKEWAGPVFLHPDNHLHKVDALTFQGGERTGRPNFSPPQ